MEIKTVSDLVTEMNRWLKVKWQHADYHCSLPDAWSAISYMRKLEVDAALRPPKETCRKLYEEHGVTQSETDIMIFGLVELILEETPEQNSICLITWLNGEEHVLLRFTLDIHHLEDGDDACNAVKFISCDTEGDTLLQDIVMEAVRLQLETGLDLNTRWLSAPESYRDDHPICPVCGSGVRLEYFEDHSAKRNAVCDFCEWGSHKKFYYISEYTEAGSFQHELQYQKKIELTSKEIEAAEALFLQAINRLSEAYGNKKKFRMTDSQYLSALDKYTKLIDKERTKAVHNINKNKRG